VVHRRVVLRAVPPVAVPAALRGVMIVAAIVMATEVAGAADDVAVVGGAAQRERLDPRHGLLPAQRPAPAVSPAVRRGRQGVAVPLRLLGLRKRLPGTRQRNAAAAAAAAAPERTVKVRRGKWDLLGPTAPAVRRPPGTEAPGRP